MIIFDCSICSVMFHFFHLFFVSCVLGTVLWYRCEPIGADSWRAAAREPVRMGQTFWNACCGAEITRERQLRAGIHEGLMFWLFNLFSDVYFVSFMIFFVFLFHFVCIRYRIVIPVRAAWRRFVTCSRMSARAYGPDVLKCVFWRWNHELKTFSVRNTWPTRQANPSLVIAGLSLISWIWRIWRMIAVTNLCRTVWRCTIPCLPSANRKRTVTRDHYTRIMTNVSRICSRSIVCLKRITTDSLSAGLWWQIERRRFTPLRSSCASPPPHSRRRVSSWRQIRASRLWWRLSTKTYKTNSITIQFWCSEFKKIGAQNQNSGCSKSQGQIHQPRIHAFWNQILVLTSKWKIRRLKSNLSFRIHEGV